MFVSNQTIFLLIVSIFISYKIRNVFQPPPLVKLEETWWSDNDPSTQNRAIRPFKIDIPEKVLDDLQNRLENTRSYTPPLEKNQQYGMNGDLLQEIITYWKTDYKWRERERYLNKYPQFLVNIQGLDIHYIHVKPQTSKKVLPLLLLHGWPGSVREFYEIIPLLTSPKNQDFAFEVIIPSLPGFGFSQTASKPGLGAAHMAIVFKNLMERLGFRRYFVQGGDFGAIILQHLSVMYPEVVAGFHNNMCTVLTPLSIVKSMIWSIYPTMIVREDHLERYYPLSKLFSFLLVSSGYLHIQATKPDTIGVGLKDSPAALAAYVLEKFSTGTNFTNKDREDGGLKKYYNYSDLLDNIMIYWVTGSMSTAVRLYAETFNAKFMRLGMMRQPIQVPAACARFRYDFYAPDGLLGEIYPHLVHLSDYEGGHFAAFQLPEVLANDIFVAVKKFQEFNNAKNRNSD